MTPMNHRLLVPRKAASRSQTLYFNDAAADADWNNVLNWWTDEACTVQASAVPTASDDAICLPAASNGIEQNTGPDAVARSYTQNGGSYFSIIITTSHGCVFNANTLIAATISGNATFNNDAQHFGTVSGNAVFNDNSSHFGTVTGTVTCNTTGTCTPQP
jgi:hypothetical protein